MFWVLKEDENDDDKFLDSVLKFVKLDKPQNEIPSKEEAATVVLENSKDSNSNSQEIEKSTKLKSKENRKKNKTGSNKTAPAKPELSDEFLTTFQQYSEEEKRTMLLQAMSNPESKLKSSVKSIKAINYARLVASMTEQEISELIPVTHQDHFLV